MLKVENINKSFNVKGGSKKVLQDVSFYVNSSEIITIMGPSGGGKSTFLKILAGIIPPDNGRIYFNNNDISKNLGLYTSHISFIFQDYKLIPHLNVLENVTLALRLRGFSDWKKRASEALEFNQIEYLAHSYPPQLSGGESQRVGIARAISIRPDIIFADEPTGNLDDETGNTIISVFKDIKKIFGTSFVIVTHDKDMQKHSDREYLLNYGNLTERGVSQ